MVDVIAVARLGPRLGISIGFLIRCHLGCDGMIFKMMSVCLEVVILCSRVE